MQKGMKEGAKLFYRGAKGWGRDRDFFSVKLQRERKGRIFSGAEILEVSGLHAACCVNRVPKQPI